MHAVVRDWRRAPLQPIERALCDYAVRLTLEPRSVRRDDLDALRAHGLDDVAFHDFVQVVAYFNSITRVDDALGVEPETFIRRWGDEDV